MSTKKNPYNSLSVGKYSKTNYNLYNDEEEKNYRKKSNFLSNTMQDFIPTENNENEQNKLSYFTNFKGFYNKKFNLTSFKKERDNSRSRSNSPERIIIPHKLKGNGIPIDPIARIKFLEKIFNSEKFKRFYKNYLNKNKNMHFDELCEHLIRYSKKHSELEGIMMAYYFVCNKIEYDYTFYDRSADYKESQQMENAFKFKKALSLGFRNVFEGILKRMEIKFKSIEGYCKLIPPRENINNDLTSSHYNNTIENSSNTNLLNNNSSKAIIKTNSSKIFSMHYKNNSSIFNSSIAGAASKTLSKFDMDREYENNVENFTNHYWDAIQYKGQWYFVDTTLGSSSYDKNKLKLEQKSFKFGKLVSNVRKNLYIDPREYSDYEENDFNPFYFMTPAELLIETHIPINNSWQLTEKICTFKQFLNKRNTDFSEFYKNIAKYDVEVISHDYPFISISIKDNLKIQIRISNFTLDAYLYDSEGFAKLNEIKASYDEKNNMFILEPSFPKIGEYIIKINIRAVNSTNLIYKHLFDYRIKVNSNLNFNRFDRYIKDSIKLNNEKSEFDHFLLPKIHGLSKDHLTQPRIITDYSKIFPSKTNKKICYDNDGFILIEPKSIYLRKGVSNKFRVIVKKANLVFLLDGNQCYTFKRVEENTYEGQKVINTENVSLCCLRSKNVFTEVFKFKTKKKLFLSKSNGIKHRVKDKLKKSILTDNKNDNSP